MTIATKENTTMASLSTLSDGIALTHFMPVSARPSI